MPWLAAPCFASLLLAPPGRPPPPSRTPCPLWGPCLVLLQNPQTLLWVEVRFHFLPLAHLRHDGNVERRRDGHTQNGGVLRVDRRDVECRGVKGDMQQPVLPLASYPAAAAARCIVGKCGVHRDCQLAVRKGVEHHLRRGRERGAAQGDGGALVWRVAGRVGSTNVVMQLHRQTDLS